VISVPPKGPVQRTTGCTCPPWWASRCDYPRKKLARQSLCHQITCRLLQFDIEVTSNISSIAVYHISAFIQLQAFVLRSLPSSSPS
jgi:hypothetical protein